MVWFDLQQGLDLERCCCTDRDDQKQVVIQRPDVKIQVIHYSHHDLPTDTMMEPPGTTLLHNRKAEALLNASDSGMQANLDEGNASALLLPEHVRRRRREAAGPKTGPGSGYAAATSSQTLERDSSEKSRVLGVMKAFAVKAFNGIDAWRIGAENGEIDPIRYVLSRDLSHLVIQAQGASSSASGDPVLRFNIGDLQGFCVGSEALQPGFLPQFLDGEMLKRLVVLKSQSGPLCILEDSAEDAERLATALWVLRSYSRQKVKGGLDDQVVLQTDAA